MRRFLTLVCLLFLAVPTGISISGCSRNPGENYCNGRGYGLKTTDVSTITLSPATTGISLAYGQTKQVSAPSALNCNGTSVGSTTFTYGTSNNKLVDISSSGNICAGTWNRNTGGGISDYTICSKPDPLPSTNGLPYSTATITASAETVSSNPVTVYVHAPVTSVGLVTAGSANKCYSQNATTTLDAQACYSGTNASGESAQVLLCAPSSVTSSSSPSLTCPLPKGVDLSSIPTCTAAIGTLTYSVGSSSIASISTDTSTDVVTITAGQPGTTSITASVAGSGSSAGYFSTCPPASISLAFADGNTERSITKGVTQNLVTTVTDTQGNPITGMSMTYESTDPIDISVSSGAITPSFPGKASIYAICQPDTCNPAPTNEFGWYGTGLPVSSNPVTVTTPGTASGYVWLSAPGQSRYFVPIELLTNTVSSPVRLPYVPNSMVMDRLGNDLYFGSSHELMVVSTTGNTLTTENINVPGVVLAVSPDNSMVLINDQAQQKFYVYNVSGGTYTPFGGLGNAAAWSPDSKTLYITDNAALNSTTSSLEQGITGHTDTLYVYSEKNWTTYALPSSPLSSTLPPGILPSSVSLPNPMPSNVPLASTVQTPALTIPSVAAYLRGSPTEAHAWCPSGTVGNYSSVTFYPLADTVEDASSTPVQTDALVSSTDGEHILGAAVSGSVVALSDIDITIPKYNCLYSDTDSGYSANHELLNGEILSPLTLTHTQNTQTLDSDKVKATAINQVIASPQSKLAFVTYTADANNTNAELPYYVPVSGSAFGTLGYVSLTGSSAISAPLAGAFTSDDTLFFVSTAGDNLLHYISVPTLTDTKQLSPDLPACTPVASGGTDAGCIFSGSGTVVPATAIAVKPRSTT
jgi:trimeric autotransporter adhesin